MTWPAIVAHHVRTGIVALNVVTAALDVHCARTPASLVEHVRALARRCGLPVVRRT